VVEGGGNRQIVHDLRRFLLGFSPLEASMSEEFPQFIGEYEDVPVDPKGRLIIPAAFRKALPMGVTTFVVARWFDGCLAAYDPAGWKKVLGKLQSLSGAKKDTRQLVRAVAGLATEVRCDTQGRVLIPKKHLEVAGISDRSTLVGVIDRVEIWNPDRYRQSIDGVNLESIAEDLDWI
jgi:MraZ protein